MSPIDLRIFKQLIPQSYTSEMETKLAQINDELLNEEKAGNEATLAGAITEERAQIPQGNIVVDQVDESNSQNSKRQIQNQVQPKHENEEMEYLDPATSGPNPINKTTFLQIANSLSPEPERLLK